MQKVLCLADNSSADAWGHKLTEKFSKENNLIFRGSLEGVDKLESG